MRPATHQVRLAAVLDYAQTGDAMFFDGSSGWFSRIIRWTTGSPTHVGIVVRRDGEPVSIVESTTLLERDGGERIRGVQRSELQWRVEKYEGRVWLACLKASARQRLNENELMRYLEIVEGGRYDMRQAIWSGVGQWVRFIPGTSRPDALFCSELYRNALVEAGLSVGVLGKDETPTPNQLSKLPIFDRIYQCKGKPREIG